MVATLFACEKNDPQPEPDAPGSFVLTEKSAKVLDAGQRFGFELFKEVHELSAVDLPYGDSTFSMVGKVEQPEYE
jgi:hypothetical protein